MLGCESKLSQCAGGIRPHWVQNFEDEDDQELRRLSDEILGRFYQKFIYQNVPELAIKRYSSQKTGGEVEGDSSRGYVNIPRCLDGLAVPQAGTGNVSLRTDLSPMSPRSKISDAASARWSTVAQVALSRLKESGFYYEKITPSQARRLLQSYPPGTFLVRASSDRRFLFSLTVRTLGMP